MLIPCLALMAGVAFSRVSVLDAASAHMALAASCAVAAVAALVARPKVTLALYALCFWMGGVTEIHHREFPPPLIDASSQETVLAAGCVVESPVWSEDRAQFVLELEPGARARVSVYLRKAEKPIELRYGDKVEVEGRFRTPRNFENPGAFDYAGYLARRRIYWQASVSGVSGVKVLPGFCGVRWRAVLADWRERALQAIDREFPPDGYANAVLRASLLGDASRLQPAWSDEFRRTGTYHVLVISGLHLTTISAVAVTLLRFLPIGVAARLLITAVLAWIYAMMCGAAAPVVRAAAGTTFFLLASYFYRSSGLLNPLALTGFLILLLDPQQLWEASFQLSFLAVAMIAALAQPVLRSTTGAYRESLRTLDRANVAWQWPAHVRRAHIELRLLGRALELAGIVSFPRFHRAVSISGALACWLGETLLVSTILQIGLLLPMVIYFHRAPVSGLLANLAVTPLMTWAVPVAFLALATGLRPFIWLTGMLVEWAHWLAGALANWDPAVRTPDPPAWLAVLALLALAATAWALRSKKKWALGLCVVTAALLAAVLAHPFDVEISRGQMELTAIDVGQGDALLLISPRGHAMLIDAGGFPALNARRVRMDTGEDVVSPYLWSRGMKRLDAVVLTHANQDHMGGVEAILENFRPREFWVSAEPDHKGFQSLLKRSRELGVRAVRRKSGEKFGWGGIDLEVLSAGNREPGERASNDDSLVLRATYGQRSFLLTGDLEKSGEYRMLAGAAPLRADVLKIAHHGSRTSSTDDFLDAVHPMIAVVSLGKDNMFRHPHPSVIERLRERGVRILRTDEYGLITVRTDGNRIAADAKLWPIRTEPWFARQQPF